VNESLALKDVALVQTAFQSSFVSQLHKDNYEVRFKRGLSRVLDAKGDIVC
jgi:hypothetical protein